MVTKISEIHSGFYFTQPDNVVMFDEVLSQTAKVVYCNLLSHVKKGTNRCKLYISTIAEEVKRSVRTVRRALSQLCERGVIVRLMQYGNKRNQLASLFVIIGKNAACYQSYNHQSVVRQTDSAEVDNEMDTGKAVTVETATAVTSQRLSIGTKMASPCDTNCDTNTRIQTEMTAETKTALLPKVSAPHAKNGRQNNNKGGNKSILKDTLIGQAELPKLSLSSPSSTSSSPSQSHQSHQQKSQLPRKRKCKKLQNDYNDAQILIDFDEQELQEPYQETQEPNKTSGQKECLTDSLLVDCFNGNNENKSDGCKIDGKCDERNNSRKTGKSEASEAVIETVHVPEPGAEDLLLSEEVKTSEADNANSNDALDALDAFDPLACVQNADKIPNNMLDTARYFLYRTGRDPRSINEKEIQAMREVFVNHYPARIQKEIDVACRRFIKNGKSLKVLFFGYIAAALRKQQSLVPFEKKFVGSSAGQSAGASTEKLAKRGEDGNIKASSGQEASQLREVSEGHRYLTSADISNKTNPLSSMSMEELLALEKELDGKMKKS